MFWDDTIVAINALPSGSQTIVDLDAGIPEDEAKGLTAIRLIIRLGVTGSAASTAGLFAAGVYLIEDDARGALSVAEPQLTGDDAGWMWRLASQLWARNADVNVAGGDVMRIGEDIHSMRKYPGEDYSLSMVVNNVSATGGMNVDGMIRTLYKRA